MLLQKGEGAYKVFDEWVDAHLIGIEHNRIPRSSGIDAILKKAINGRIGFIRVQRKSETLSEAILSLSKAVKTKNNTQMILIKTSGDLLECTYSDIHIINSPALAMKSLENSYSSNERLSCN